MLIFLIGLPATIGLVVLFYVGCGVYVHCRDKQKA